MRLYKKKTERPNLASFSTPPAMLEELKREAFEANLLLPKLGLINLTFGNASALDRGRGIFAIKPSGIDYDLLKVEDMVLVDLDDDHPHGVGGGDPHLPEDDVRVLADEVFFYYCTLPWAALLTENSLLYSMQFTVVQQVSSLLFHLL